ncbi:DNA transfer protein [Erwinia aphidicola]|uniref:DNA transfer protein n=1 Tax=Erwinia aphidicola TaxID=68334 RepID=UPI001745D6C7|nr:DNA transfer protein [Erwinia aphidicola]MBD1377187.1 DNA transfer protein [Erwinia aphidicola]
MAKAWKEVIASPQYQSLPPDQQAAAQEQYFNEVVSPQAGESAEQAKQAFFSAYPPATQSQQQSSNQQEPSFLQQAGNAIEQAGRGLVNIPFDALQGGASLINAVSQGVGVPKLLEDVYRPVDRPTDPYAQAGESIGNYLTPGLGVAGNMVAGSLAEAGNQQGDFAENAAKNAVVNLGAQGVLSGAAKAVGRGITALRGQVNPEVTQLIAGAEAAGVTPMTSDVLPPSGAFTKGLVQGGEGALLGTGAARAAQQDARQGIIQSYQSKFGEYAPEAVIDSLQRGVRAERNAAGELLSQVSTQMKGRTVPANKTIASLDSAIADLNKLGTLKDTGAVSVLEGLRGDLQKSPVSYDDFRNLRSAFREGVKGDNIAMRGRTEAIIDRVYKSMSDDLTSSVGRTLGPGTASKYAAANNAYGTLANRVKNTALKRVLEKGEYVPEVVNSVVYSSKPSEVRNLYSLLDEKGKDAMRAAYISKVAEKSGDSPARFMSEVNRLRKNPAINDVLGPRHVKELNGLMDVLRLTNRADSASVVTQTGQALANPVRLGSAVVSQGSSLAAEAGYGLMTRVYESKPVRNALLRLSNTKPGSPAYERALNQAATMVRPLLATEVTSQQ